MSYGEFILNHKEKECDWEEYKSPHEVIKNIVYRLESLLNRMRAYSSLFSALGEAIIRCQNDVAVYESAIRYLYDEIFIFLSDLDTLFKEAYEEKKNL